MKKERIIHQIKKNKSIYDIYIKSTLIAFSIVLAVTMAIMSFLFSFLSDYGLSASLFTSFVFITSIITLILSIHNNINIASWLLLISILISWSVFPYLIINTPILTSVLWTDTAMLIAIIPIAGYLINRYAAFIFAFASLINLSVISCLNNDSNYFLFEFPFLLQAFLISSIFIYYAIHLRNNILNTLEDYRYSIKNSEKKYKLLFDVANDAKFVYPMLPEGENAFNEVNTNACNMLNYSKEELLKLKPADIMKYNYTAQERAKILNNIKSGKGVMHEAILMTKDGKELPVEISSQLFFMQEKPYIISVARDISKRRRAEQKLKERETDYHSLFENMLNGFAYFRIILDEYDNPFDYLYIEVNKVYEKLTGLKRENIIGKRFTEFIPPDFAKSDLYWIDYYGKIALHKLKEIQFEQYSKYLNKWFYIYVYSPKKYYFATVFEDITERKLTQRALQESEEHFRRIVEYSPFPIVIIRKEIVEYLNPKFEELFGYTIKEIPEQRYWYEKAYPDIEYRKAALAEWASILQEFETKSAVNPRTIIVKCKDGTYKNVIFRIVDMGDDRLLMFIEDVTERKKAENALKESEEKYRTLFETSTDAIFIENIDGEILDCNYSACSLYGYTKEEMVKLNAYDLTPKRFHERLRNVVTKELKENKLNIEMRGKKKDGTEFPVEVNISVNNIMGERVIIVYVRDITERKKATDELIRQKTMLDEVFNGVQEAINIVNEDEIIIYCNPASFELFEDKNLIGKNFLDYVDEETKIKVLKETEKRKKNTSSTYVIPIYTKEGNKKYISLSTSPRFNDKGEYKGAFGALLDVTELKKAEEALKENEEKYRTLVENSNDAIMVSQEDYLKFFNKRAIELWSYSEKELATIPVNQLVAPEDRQNFYEVYINREKNGIDNANRYEVRAITKYGKRIWVDINAVNTYWEGKPALLGFIRDITSQKMTEYNLR
ncbi:MAG: PAS domain S-box protein, partial [Spirochaetota bacterium]